MEGLGVLAIARLAQRGPDAVDEELVRSEDRNLQTPSNEVVLSIDRTEVRLNATADLSFALRNTQIVVRELEAQIGPTLVGFTAASTNEFHS